jgi:hypothetical protein
MGTAANADADADADRKADLIGTAANAGGPAELV